MSKSKSLKTVSLCLFLLSLIISFGPSILEVEMELQLYWVKSVSISSHLYQVLLAMQKQYK